jgi:hypothetical protein
MQLKRYQERVVREAKFFLEALATQQASANKHASEDAWDVAKMQFDIRGQYRPRKNGLGKDLPTFCITVMKPWTTFAT